MNLSATDITQIVSWLLALVQFALGLTVLVTNHRSWSNRFAGAMLIVFAANNLAAGVLNGALTVQDAHLATAVLALTVPLLRPALVLTTLAFFAGPHPSPGRRAEGSFNLGLPPYLRGPGIAVLLLAALPVVLTLIDLVGSPVPGSAAGVLWFTGLDPATYAGGFAPLTAYTGGVFGQLLPILNVYVMSAALAGLYLFFIFKPRPPAGGTALYRNRGILWGLLGTHLAAVGLQIALYPWNGTFVVLLISSLYTFAYGWIIFRWQIFDPRQQSGSLRTRLTILVLVITVPVLAAGFLFITDRAAARLENNALRTLESSGRSLSSNTAIWLQSKVQALNTMANLPTLQSMDPTHQEPALVAMQAANPEFYLVSTTDRYGLNVARSDGNPLTNYYDRNWFLGARANEPVTFQTLVGRTSNLPAVVVSVPIHDPQGRVAGVLMVASLLTELGEAVEIHKAGENSTAYVIDEFGRLVAGNSPTGEGGSAQLQLLDDYPPVKQLLRPENVGFEGQINFTDADGRDWVSYANRLDNGWIVVVQQSVTDLLATRTLFQRLSWLVIIGFSAALFGLLTLTIRQSLLPIGELTAAAEAIQAGDLNRQVDVPSQDELGILGQAFNAMTAQLRDLIADLEARVQERTAELKSRALQLQVAAEVAREAAEIHKLEDLLSHAVHLISDRFGYYHAGLFLLDENRQNAVLRAASSEGGQRMLARGHRLVVGQTGIVGYVAAQGRPRIALDVGADAVYFDNPDLPDTRSEAAIPLNAQNRVIGVLDVQSTEPGAFSEADLEVFQILADQIALAIENARLLASSDRALEELQTVYGRQVASAWRQKQAGQALGFILDREGIHPARPGPAAGGPASTAGDPAEPDENGRNTEAAALPPDHVIHAPLKLRGQALGVLTLQRAAAPEGATGPDALPPFTPEERAIVEKVVRQAVLALENARLLEEVRSRAEQERLVGHIVSQAQRSFDLDSLLKITVREIGQALDMGRVQIRLTPEAQTADGNGQETGHLAGDTP